MTAEWVDRLPEHGSWSQLHTWSHCQVAYSIERGFHPPEMPAWWFIGGTAFHEATEDWDTLYANDKSDAAANGSASSALLGLFVSRFNDGISKAEKIEPDRTLWRAADKGKQREKFYRDSAPKWCEMYVQESQYWPVHILPNDTLAIEAEFDIQLGGITVKGYIDRLRMTKTGMLGVEDLKTGKKNGEPGQLGLYAVAADLQWGERPTWGRFWNPRLGGGSVPISLEEFTQEYWDFRYAEFESGRRSGEPVPNIGVHCKWCSVRPYCKYQNGAKAVDL